MSNSPSAICWKNLEHHKSRTNRRRRGRWARVMLPGPGEVCADSRYPHRKQLNYFLVLDLIANYQ